MVITMSETFKTQQDERITRLSVFLDKYLVTNDKVSLYREFEETLKTVQPLDLFYLPFFSDDSRLSLEEIKSYANRFVNLFYHGLVSFQWDKKISPMLEKFVEENQAILAELDGIKPYFENDKIEESVPMILTFFEKIEVIEKKFQKSQMMLYPALEKKLPSKKPFQVLWAVEDDILEERKTVITRLKQDPINWAETKIAIAQFYYQLAGLIQKENIIVLPLASIYLTAKDWEKMIDSAFEIGYAFTHPLKVINQTTHPEMKLSDLMITTDSGVLSVEQFNLVMSHLPIAITYVDEFDIVRYYNQTSERHFPRTPQAIGREVKYCHPEKSVHIVEKILAEFKANRQSVAQFWMDFRGKKLLISYYAVRNDSSDYKGVIEVTQDISGMNEFQGEKRLLNWE